MCGGGAFSSIKVHSGWPQGSDGGLVGLSDAELMDDNQIESAIQLLQQHKDLQQDQVGHHPPTSSRAWTLLPPSSPPLKPIPLPSLKPPQPHPP